MTTKAPINERLHKRRKNKVKLSGWDIAFNIFNYTILSLITIACVFPFYYLFINTISSNELVRLGQIQLYPREIHFENYVQVFKLSGIADATLVSISRTALGTAWTVAGSAFLGYLVTKHEMWLRTLWYRLIIITMYFSAGLIPWYINLKNLGFLDNFWVYVIPGLVSPYNVILVKTFIEGLPSSLEESAMLDGAGYTRVFASVIVPLITPILATLCIFCAVGQWNSFTDTMMLMPSGKFYTLQYMLYRYQHEAQSLAALVRTTQNTGAIANLAVKQTALSVQMTVAMVVVFPILMVYPFFQRYFVKGIMIGAVKG
ncbi:MAG: carbohydrate ABC transporter permease [Eubacteriales bacterium]|nr:carbohydrate ABC transporter permease [Eubacteriales bacterium]MDD3882281.1 carbohydrate ABC transporter permease [Eubacteriales bacterium]MDD4512027.1 carbohydrate ABC transporter permease [Eubacteriales bacterium]